MNKLKWLIFIVCFLFILGMLVACQSAEAEGSRSTNISVDVAEKLSNAKINFNSAYQKLKEKHSEYKNSDDLDEWKSFSSEWLVETKNIRHGITEDKIDKTVKGKINVLENIREILFDIWNAYNEDINERPFDSEKLENDRRILEILIEKFE